MSLHLIYVHDQNEIKLCSYTIALKERKCVLTWKDIQDYLMHSP